MKQIGDWAARLVKQNFVMVVTAIVTAVLGLILIDVAMNSVMSGSVRSVSTFNLVLFAIVAIVAIATSAWLVGE